MIVGKCDFPPRFLSQNPRNIIGTDILDDPRCTRSFNTFAVPPGANLTRLVSVVGLQRAKDLMLSGRWVSSSEAQQIGISDEVVEQPYERALELAQSVSRDSGDKLGAIRVALEKTAFGDFDKALKAEWDVVESLGVGGVGWKNHRESKM